VDADTVINAAAVGAVLVALRGGAAGGGFTFRFDGRVPLWARLVLPLAIFVQRRIRLVGGCCLFCTREGFQAAGGFCERFYAAEEAAFAQALKRQGPFVIPRELVVTSGRKIRTLSPWQIASVLFRLAARGPAAFQTRDDIWYGPRQEDQGEPQRA
jgi:hypothetical protein